MVNIRSGRQWIIENIFIKTRIYKYIKCEWGSRSELIRLCRKLINRIEMGSNTNESEKGKELWVIESRDE